MRRRGLSEFALGMALKVVLDRIGDERTAEAVAPRRPTGGRAAHDRSPGSSRSRPLTAFMFGSLAVALVLMLVFHAPVTRAIGVAAIFAFIVSGVFLIADPSFLGPEEDQEPRSDRVRG